MCAQRVEHGGEPIARVVVVLDDEDREAVYLSRRRVSRLLWADGVTSATSACGRAGGTLSVNRPIGARSYSRPLVDYDQRIIDLAARQKETTCTDD